LIPRIARSTWNGSLLAWRYGALLRQLTGGPRPALRGHDTTDLKQTAEKRCTIACTRRSEEHVK
jgi:hypothetical protein